METKVQETSSQEEKEIETGVQGDRDRDRLYINRSLREIQTGASE